MKILIDGENLRHRVAEILYRHKKIRDKNSYFKFDLAGFLKDALRVDKIEAVYYTTRVKQPVFKIPNNLTKLISAITDSNRRWLADLANQKITVVKAGYLTVRESNKCVHCGKRTMVLQEKGVDVRIATDLVVGDPDYDNGKNVVLGSSDSDLIPSIQAAIKAGVKIIYFCYAGSLNRAVSTQVNKTTTFDDNLVIKHFEGKA